MIKMSFVIFKTFNKTDFVKVKIIKSIEINVNIHWQFLKIVHWRRTSFRKPRGVRRKNSSHSHHPHQEHPGSVLIVTFLQHEMCCQPLLYITLFMRKRYTNYDAVITSEHYLYILIGSCWQLFCRF